MTTASTILTSERFWVFVSSALILASGCDSGVSSPAQSVEIEPAGPDRIQPDRIQPHPENPWYWMYDGEPVFLIGGSEQDNLFNHPHLPPNGLEAHLDLLVSVGGNYVRNTMSSRNEGNLWPFRSTAPGVYDLDSWDESYWTRLENFLEMTEERRIIVQVEVWDRWDFSREPWDANPFNPVNNITYTEQQSGLPASIRSDPARRENPFFRSTPGQDGNSVILRYQEAFVEKLLSISLPFPHVLYTVSNETNEGPAWSAYWADFIREWAEEAGYPVHVTEMWDAWDLRDPIHDHSFGDAVRYSFLEVSQNNHQVGETHWDRLQVRRRSIASHPRPMNNVKIYGGRVLGGGFEEGTRKLWRNVFGGAASVRFHRPDEGAYGIGLNAQAQSHIRSLRMLVGAMDVFSAEPRNDLLSNRDVDEAYAMAEIGRTYAVYFTDGGSVSLDLTGADGPLSFRWLDILAGEWTHAATVQAAQVQVLPLHPPGPGPWVALLHAAGGG